MSKWIPDTTRLMSALDKVHTEYTEIIGNEVKNSLEQHNNMIDRLRQVEKQASSVNTQVSKQLAKSDTTDLATESDQLEKLLASVESKMDDCIDRILSIDQYLSPHERLIAPGLPKDTQFPLLHDRISERSLAKSPALLEVHKARPEIQVSNDYATNTNTNLQRSSSPS